MLSRKKTVLVIGSGGREHALAWKLAQSPLLGSLYAAPGNAGIAELATCVPVRVDDVPGQVRLAQQIAADLVVVGPELPLSLGLVDQLEAVGIAAVGPTRAAARVESSKQFAKEVMQAAGIPTAAHHVATDMAAAEKIIRHHFAQDDSSTTPLVVKADGLAAGKGVVICPSEQEALDVCRDMLSGALHGGAGTTVVLEQFLSGPELSLLAFTDGERYLLMPLTQDYKRLLTGDAGPNTGGMGSISPVPGYDDAFHAELGETCVKPLLAEMARRGTPFKGILFAGLMLTPAGPMVLEYNARFGDPETQSLMRRLDSDLLELFLAVVEGDLSEVEPRWSDAAACCVAIAAKGYPYEPERGVPIEGVDSLPAAGRPGAASAAKRGAEATPERSADSVSDGVVIFHGATGRNEHGQLVSDGGRVLSVTATGRDLPEAVERAYAAVATISFPGSYYRTDIGRLS